jgi:urease accessory protein
MPHSSDWQTWQVVDSAFPVGVFAHSWGLEAAWSAGYVDSDSTLQQFLLDSIQQTGWGPIPLLNSAYRQPTRLRELDELANAFLTNSVANRASRSQGRTFIATASQVWPSEAMAELEDQVASSWAHVAPFSGVAFRIIGLPYETAQKAVLYGTARGILSAAVRLGIIGSYQAQRMQYDAGQLLDVTLKRCKDLDAESLCQTAPVLDLLQGVHDRLYSRLFQS